jgi:hypothetical protein
MKVSPKTQTIFVAGVVLLFLAFLGYKLFVQQPSVDTSTTLTDTGLPGQDILTLVQKLNAVSINQGIFQNPMFSNLRDFSQTIFPEAQGRVNPFATIGSDSNSSASTQKQTQTQTQTQTTGL